MELDHVNLRSAEWERLGAWYEAVLGLQRGWRPPFPFPGLWLYAGDKAVVHVVGVSQQPEGKDPTLQHFALRSRDLPAFLARLETLAITPRLRSVPGTALTQVNLIDPDGNNLHVDFAESL